MSYLYSASPVFVRPLRKGATVSKAVRSSLCVLREIKLLAELLMTDVHATSDGVILMFHDPTLDRTTTGTGLIKNQPWKGVIE